MALRPCGPSSEEREAGVGSVCEVSVSFSWFRGFGAYLKKIRERGEGKEEEERSEYVIIKADRMGTKIGGKNMENKYYYL